MKFFDWKRVFFMGLGRSSWHYSQTAQLKRNFRSKLKDTLYLWWGCLVFTSYIEILTSKKFSFGLNWHQLAPWFSMGLNGVSLTKFVSLKNSKISCIYVGARSSPLPTWRSLPQKIFVWPQLSQLLLRVINCEPEGTTRKKFSLKNSKIPCI